MPAADAAGIGDEPDAFTNCSAPTFPVQEEEGDIHSINPAIVVGIGGRKAGLPVHEEGINILSIDTTVLIEVTGRIQLDGRNLTGEAPARVTDQTVIVAPASAVDGRDEECVARDFGVHPLLALDERNELTGDVALAPLVMKRTISGRKHAELDVVAGDEWTADRLLMDVDGGGTEIPSSGGTAE